MRNLLRTSVCILALCGCAAAAAQDAVADAVADAIQERVERLMFDGELYVDEVPILARETVAELYTSRQYRPLWADMQVVGQLAELAQFAYTEGLDPSER